MELAKFYRDILGLPFDKELSFSNDKGIQFKIGEVYFFVGYHDKVFGKAKDPYRVMIGFDVDSVKKTCEELTQKGVQFIQPAIVSPDGTFMVATACDPEGNIIQFYGDLE
ncbi:MAG: Protein containing Glyoxalase/bleomycin resistance protein/dioxygenase-like protein [candidate division CPR1 bacterium GW2011_GWA2_42_17]|uniref:Protein containing Glyoxalase/bleomycin resistance protein/dioxygenase-like protein n=1 Tax=candidate division CPR1 bacterium GW2011_GWA2_42_17 TaxID=1618341 RepID=A0A0G1BCC6_9BACT|nr:MAG: Protein containing Glyoxalase/bleomycin resistance protein/dioxygenase-like protein [candidate division CPR1 bacterium GW2011_GWA2_42_17]